MSFWRETFDDMARHRYTLIFYWSLNPFPSIVKVPPAERPFDIH